MRTILFILAFSFLPLLARAYLLPAASVLQKAVQQRSGLKRIEWMAKVTDLKSNFVFLENLWIDFENGKVGANYLSSSNELLGSTQTTLNTLGDFGRFWLSIGLDPSIARTRKAMQELRVAPEPGAEAALARVGMRVAWTWGEAARIFFEKDDFTPLQYLRDTEGRTEALVFNGFAVASDKARVPKSVVFRSGGRDLFVFELKAIKVDLPLKEKAANEPAQDGPLKEWVSLVR
ncbi:hypothetical protein EB061_03065 [bacterium]|nr:hypothetical protein [bacterium]